MTQRNDTSLRIADEETAEMFRRRRDGRGMTNSEYLDFLLTEATIYTNRERLIEQTKILNEKLEGVDARDEQ